MKLVLVCSAVALLMSAVEPSRPARRRQSSIEEMYCEANITTPVPKNRLEVDFGGLEVSLGMEISPTEAMDAPSIEFDTDSGCYYTVIGIGLDCPTPDDPYLGPFLFALYANVYTESGGKAVLEDSCEIARWRAVSPPPGSGRHRFLLYVYEQKEMIDLNSLAARRLQFMLIRCQLSYIVKALDLISPPVAGTFYYMEYPL